jgi:hypothetical protein
MLHQQMVDEELPFVILGFLFNPELVFGNKGETIMLTEIGKFFVDMAPDVTAIDDPYLKLTSFIYLFEIR